MSQCILVRILQSNKPMFIDKYTFIDINIYVYMYIYKEIYYKELAYIIMECWEVPPDCCLQAGSSGGPLL